MILRSLNRRYFTPFRGEQRPFRDMRDGFELASYEGVFNFVRGNTIPSKRMRGRLALGPGQAFPQAKRNRES